MFCRSQDGNLVQLGAGAYGQASWARPARRASSCHASPPHRQLRLTARLAQRAPAAFFCKTFTQPKHTRRGCAGRRPTKPEHTRTVLTAHCPAPLKHAPSTPPASPPTIPTTPTTPSSRRSTRPTCTACTLWRSRCSRRRTSCRRPTSGARRPSCGPAATPTSCASRARAWTATPPCWSPSSWTQTCTARCRQGAGPGRGAGGALGRLVACMRWAGVRGWRAGGRSGRRVGCGAAGRGHTPSILLPLPGWLVHCGLARTVQAGAQQCCRLRCSVCLLSRGCCRGPHSLPFEPPGGRPRSPLVP